MPIRIHALIPAAGQSLRFGGTIIKQYANLLGRPVICHTIDALTKHPAVAAVTVAISADDGLYEELVRPEYPQIKTIHGGDSRARTVLNGLQNIASGDRFSEWVLVHDAARPCLTTEAMDRLVNQAESSGKGCILAIPISDTVKQADDNGNIVSTVNREDLWAAQTPQLFPMQDLLQSLSSAMRFGEPPTDEAEAMERAGHACSLVMGSSDNIKITRPEDLAIAEAILKRQKGRKRR